MGERAAREMVERERGEKEAGLGMAARRSVGRMIDAIVYVAPMMCGEEGCGWTSSKSESRENDEVVAREAEGS